MIRMGEYAIEVSDKCYAVGKVNRITVKKTDKETGIKTEEEKDYLVNPSYATSLASALKCIRKAMHRDALKSIEGDIKAALDAIQRCDEQFEQLLAVTGLE